MPPRVATEYHDSTVLGSAIALTENYGNYQEHDMQVNQTYGGPQTFFGFVQSVHINLTSVAAAPTTATLRICLDTTGNISILPDVQVTLAYGITTANLACGAAVAQIPIAQILSGNKLYLFVKTDGVGTSATLSNSCITWSF